MSKVDTLSSYSGFKHISLRRLVKGLWDSLPYGGSLPANVWQSRHRFLLGLTWFHALLIALIGPLVGYDWEMSLGALFRDNTVLHTVSEGLVVAFFASLGAWKTAHRAFRATAVGFGLMTASAILVHLSGGYIELHFHFFVMLSFMALYQDWIPYLLAIVYVAIHHGVFGVLLPQEVYNHPAAIQAPWTWASIHAFFVLWAAVGSVIAWRFNERAVAQTRLILESAGEGIFGVDRSGKITFMNPASAAILECDCEDAIGKSMSEFLRHTRADSSDFPDHKSPMIESLEQGVRHHATDELFWRRNGTNVPVEYVCTPIFEREEITGIVVALTDISKRKQREFALRESEERFRQIAESIKEVFWITDPVKNERLYVSPAYREIWGQLPLSPASMSQSWLGFIHPDDLSRVLAAVKTKQAKGQYDEEYRILRPDGSIRWVRDRAFPVKKDSGEVYRMIGIAEDITEQKQAKADLQNRCKELEILHDLSQMTLKAADLKLLLEQILERTLSVLPFDVGNIRLFETIGRMPMGAHQGYRNPENTRNFFVGLKKARSSAIALQVIASGKTLVVKNLTTADGLPAFKEEGVCSAMVASIATQDETLGLIEVGSRTPRSFGPDDVRLLEAVAGQVSSAVHKARLLEETQSRANEQEALNIIAKSINQSLEIDEILTIALDKVREVTGRERTSIRLKDHVTGQVRLAAHRGFSQPEIEELGRRASHAVSQKVFATGQPVVINNAAEATEIQSLLPNSHSVAWIPVKAGSKVVGVMGVSAEQPTPFDLHETNLLQAIGNMIGVALENARLFGETQARLRDLQTLHAISDIILDSRDLQVLMERILDKTFEINRFDVGLIRLLDAKGESLAPVASRGYRDPQNVQGHRRHVDGYTTGAGTSRVIDDKRIHVIDLGQNPGMRTFKKEGICTLVAIPLRSHDDVLGVIQLGSRTPREFHESELRILEAIGNQAGIAIQKARLYEETKRAEEALAQKAEELARSNTELQQFAYIASHDLQEPLRMVAGYTQLLAKRYKGKLDADAEEFIAFAVDGATRMRALIHSLLDYSRVGTKAQEFQPTACERVFDITLKNLQMAIDDSKAVVTHDPLPTIQGDAIQIGQLFQNLIGNAIKFRGDKPPKIHVAAEKNGGEWIFSVRDDGIGIDPQYAERVFIIFQRLHGREEYSGTGIGLAVCKKIVERHGGRIWVESESGKGSTFRFTIPV